MVREMKNIVRLMIIFVTLHSAAAFAANETTPYFNPNTTTTRPTTGSANALPIYVLSAGGATLILFIIIIIIICCCRRRRTGGKEQYGAELEERNVEKSVQPSTLQSLRIETENFPRFVEALEAGPFDARAISIVDRILQRGNEALKKMLLRHLEHLLAERMTKEETRAKCKIWAGTHISTGKITLVCLYKGNLNSRLERFFNIDIFYNNVEKPGPLIDVVNTNDMKWTTRSKMAALSIQIQYAIEKHGSKLFGRHSNLQAICGGPFLLHERQGFVQTRTTIILYCHAKGYKPFGEQEFPSVLEVNNTYIPVDIREGYFAQSIGDTAWHERLCMGISIGEGGQHFSGTLGPFVDLGNDSHGFLTCAHVVGEVGTYVVQPSEEDIRGRQQEGTTICGSVERRVFNTNFTDGKNGLPRVVGVDAALIRLNEDRPRDPPIFPPIPSNMLHLIGGRQPLYTGGSIGCSQDSSNIWGKSVFKYGRTTGFRTGFMALEGIMVKTSDWRLKYEKWKQAHIMKGQYLIYSTNAYGPFAEPGPHRFADLGDSGAGVFMIDDKKQLTLIGLVIGILCTKYDHGCIVTPIEYVLGALEVSKGQLRFAERMETEVYHL